jgi:uncharacterized protein YndB with AHSA1/START domain
MKKHSLKIEANGDRELVMTRAFDAPRSLVWDALTKPELIKRWLGVGYVDGTTMAVCDVDLRVGGKYRYVWRRPNGWEMGMGGVYREIKKPERLVATEHFDDSWYPGDAVDTQTLAEKGGTTTLTTTVLYESREARDAVLKSPMESGVEAGYNTLEAVLADMAKGSGG